MIKDDPYKTMKNISTTTALYGVIGSPVQHSLSPFIFNFLFQEMGIDAVYLAFDNRDVASLLKAMRVLPVSGFSITLPHKHEAVEFVDKLSPLAKQLGAINTAVYREGVITGYNFDGLGALMGLERKLPNWREHNILILGAGGSAMGIAQTIMSDSDIGGSSFKKTLGIASRNQDKGEALVSRLKTSGGKSEWVSLEKLQKALPENEKPLDYGIVIQTTPLGMARVQQKHSEDLPMLIENLSKDTWVYDIIYTPLQTQFLKAAAERGMPTLSGLDMFLEQAIMQFEVFTEKKLPDELRDILLQRLIAKLSV